MERLEVGVHAVDDLHGGVSPMNYSIIPRTLRKEGNRKELFERMADASMSSLEDNVRPWV